MAGPTRTEAVVLRGMRYGEADRILHVFTPEGGRRSVIARGARRPRSKLGGRLEPPALVTLDLHEGRGDIATVTGAATIAPFSRLRTTLATLDAATQACADVDRLFGPGEPHPPVFHLLVNYLRLLDERAGADPGWPAVHLAFRLKLLLGAGLQPELDACVRCRAPGPLVAFSAADGGLLCPTCRRTEPSLRPEVPGAMRALLGQPMAEADAELGGVAARQVDGAAAGLAEQHLGARLRALRIEG